MKRVVSLALALVLVMALFAGCGKTDAPAAAGTAEGGSAITVALSTVANNLDPAFVNHIDCSIMMGHVYDNLIECDENFALQPGVAASWEQPDELTYVFTIGEGFKFHNGAELTMDDVLYSIERLANVAQMASTYEKIESVTTEGNTLCSCTCMISRSTRHYMDLAVILYLLWCNPKTRKINSPIFYYRCYGILYGPWLLMDFLHHEMLKTAFFSSFGIPFNFC